ncbi:MAG: T9SS type A sorting domain-containing protein [Bacteroidetes bacterium]|nr:T9SS type A sorting domain-containing protein [Bacteroidota bacterium]
MAKIYSILFILFFIKANAQTYIGEIGGERPIYSNVVFDGNNRLYSANSGKISVCDTNGRLVRIKILAINGDSGLAWSAQLVTQNGVLVLLTTKVVAFLDTNLNTISWSANFPSGTFLRSAAEIDKSHVYIAADNTTTFYKIRISDAAEIRSFNLKKSMYVPRNFHVDTKNGDLLLHLGVLWRFDTLGNDKGSKNIYHGFAWFTSDTTFISGNDVKNTIDENSVTGRKIMSLNIKRFGIVSNLYKPNVVFKTKGGNYLVLNSTQKTSAGGYIYKFSSTGEWITTLGRPVTVSTNSWDDRILPTPELLSLDEKGNLSVLCGLNSNGNFGPCGLSRGAICSFSPTGNLRYAFDLSGNIEHFAYYKNKLFVQSDGKFQEYDSNIVAIGSYMNCNNCGEFIRDEAENTYWTGHRINPGMELENFVLFKNNKYGTFPQVFGKTGRNMGEGEIAYTTSLVKLKNGNFVVADINQHQIYLLDKDANFLSFLAGYGYNQENVNLPNSLAIDQYDNIFLSEAGNNRIKVLNKDGKLLGNFGSKGSLPGQFDSPAAIVIDTLHNVLYIADRNNARVQIFKLNYPLEKTLKTEFVSQKKAMVYPNPANDNVTIESVEIIKEYTISDISGRVVLSGQPISNNVNIDISMMENGTYFITVKTSNGIQTLKFIKW